MKIPVTRNGYKAIKQLRSRDARRVLATTIYSADEAFLAAMNGWFTWLLMLTACNYSDGIGRVFDLMQMLKTTG